MPRLPFSSRKSKEPIILSPEAMAARLPATARESVKSWPFEDIPLGPETRPQASLADLRKPAGTLLRMTGFVTDAAHWPEHGMTLRVAEPATEPSWITMRTGHDMTRYGQLSGLFLDGLVQLDDEPDRIGRRDGTLLAVHGVQMPLQVGDTSGIARGIVKEVERGALNAHESYGVTLAIGAKMTNIHIDWNPSNSHRLEDTEILELGSVVAIEADHRGATNHYRSHLMPGSYHLLERPSA
ncbi:MAG TPA: hypothetical protein VLH38_00430 [Patescibacteria group bacterium]|nr:hypothetical protein [Patescibacteria group bacterium]